MSESVWTQHDYVYMAQAIKLAWKGLYTTEPNPRVGCVIVKNGRVVGSSWHQKAGAGHAEVNAIRDAGKQAENATVYVSLEPCSHFGKTPPCVNALIDAGVTRVVAAMKDPNPEVSGKGFAMLEAAGIQVQYGLLAAQAEEINPGFIKRMRAGRPWVRIKMAISVDGRTAMASGESQWITGPAARADVQRLRARSSAVVSGIGTIVHDDAALTVRSDELGLENAGFIAERQPLRVILDTDARINAASKLFAQAGPVLLVVSSEAQVSDDILRYPEVSVWRLPVESKVENSKVKQIESLLAELASRDCNEILVEAGAVLAGSFIQAECWDELLVYMAPKLMGSAARPLAELPLDLMSQAKNLTLKDMRIIGDDIRLIYHREEPAPIEQKTSPE